VASERRSPPYVDEIQLSKKESVWFEKSGHMPLQYQPNKIVDVLVNHVLA
jgi:hypothetical protein